ncbi:hypothetical protein DBZ36_06755 [Alginatibacterium sediminis]|uniref:Uncharacterized protein n=1 Tax=Alginatibacterium sediminis TaxID=2164068 RepID=A0A420EHD0_9ALTE|nr:hypothetical protein DBZ36_06755 [Alginatibacterium sediminis]
MKCIKEGYLITQFESTKTEDIKAQYSFLKYTSSSHRLMTQRITTKKPANAGSLLVAPKY